MQDMLLATSSEPELAHEKVLRYPLSDIISVNDNDWTLFIVLVNVTSKSLPKRPIV